MLKKGPQAINLVVLASHDGISAYFISRGNTASLDLRRLILSFLYSRILCWLNQDFYHHEIYVCFLSHSRPLFAQYIFDVLWQEYEYCIPWGLYLYGNRHRARCAFICSAIMHSSIYRVTYVNPVAFKQTPWDQGPILPILLFWDVPSPKN